ncbi:MAG: antibiotic biosynthesis monooxygenase [Nitrospirae bacterium]|nr:antibiotic biosynthesis monooxygenase [Nitrospirota bacterium]
MYVTSVNVYVKKDHVEDFIEATRANHEGSVKEPGNMRFDVLQGIADPAKFLLYEAYESEEAAKAHKETPHYKLWKETVEPWMDKPREGTPHRVICPVERSRW